MVCMNFEREPKPIMVLALVNWMITVITSCMKITRKGTPKVRPSLINCLHVDS